MKQLNFTEFLAFLMKKADLGRNGSKTEQIYYLEVCFSGNRDFFIFFLFLCDVMEPLFETPHLPRAYIQSFVRLFHKYLNITYTV